MSFAKEIVALDRPSLRKASSIQLPLQEVTVDNITTVSKSGAIWQQEIA